MVPHIDYSITYRSLHGLTTVCLSYKYPNTLVNLFILMLPFLLHHASDKKFSRHSSLDPQFGISATSLNCVYIKSFQVWHRDLPQKYFFMISKLFLLLSLSLFMFCFCLLLSHAFTDACVRLTVGSFVVVHSMLRLSFPPHGKTYSTNSII